MVVAPTASLQPSAERKEALFAVYPGLRPRLVYVGPLALVSCDGLDVPWDGLGRAAGIRAGISEAGWD